MTREELIRYLEQRFGSGQREAIERYVASLSDTEIQNMAGAAGRSGLANPDAVAEDFALWQSQGRKAEEKDRKEEEDKEPRTPQEQFVENVRQQVEGGAAENEILATLLEGGAAFQPSPAWNQLTGGRPVDEETQRLIISTYNALVPEDEINETDFYAFMARFNSGNPMAAQAASIGLAGMSNTVREIKVPGKQPRYIEEDVFLRAQTMFDGSERQNLLGRTIAIATQFGISKEGDNDWLWAAVLADSHGIYRTPAVQQVAQARQQRRSRGETPPPFEVRGESGPGDPRRRRSTGISSPQVFGPPAPSQQINMLVGQFNAAMRHYGDPGLAIIATHDRDLADAIYEQGGVTHEQAVKVRRILSKIDPDFFAKAQVNFDPFKFEALVNPESSYGMGRFAAAGGDRVQMVPMESKARMENAMKALWNSWFGRDPSAGELSSFTSRIESMIMGEYSKAVAARNRRIGNIFKGTFDTNLAAEPILVPVEHIDAEEELRKAAKSLPEYQRLFGKKDPNITEEEYMQQFEAAASALLGPEAIPFRMKAAGMMTGNIQTTLGQIAGSRAALENSTFRQRVARAAEVFNRMT